MAFPSSRSALLAWLNAYRQQVYESRWLFIAYLGFMVSYFFVSYSKWHNNIYYIFVLTPFVLVFPFGRVRYFLGSTTYSLSIAYIVSLWLTLFWSGETYWRNYTKYGFDVLYVFSFITVTIDLIIRDRHFIETLFKWLFWSVAISAPIAMLYFFFLAPPYVERLNGIGRLDHPGIAAATYGTIALFCFYHHFQRQNKENSLRFFWGYVMIVSFLFMVLTQSRGPLLALICTICIVALLLKQVKVFYLIMGILLSYLLLVQIDLIQPSELLTRGGGDSFRLAIWSQSVEQIAQSPWLGYGVATSFNYDLPPAAGHSLIDHPHNIFLASMLYGGIVPLILLVGVIVSGLKSALGYYRKTSDLYLLTSILFGTLYLLTDGYRLISSPKPFWIYFWLPLAIVCGLELAGTSAMSRKVPLVRLQQPAPPRPSESINDEKS